MGSAQFGEEKSKTSSLYVPKSAHSIVDYIEGGGVYEMKFERRVLFPWLPHLVKHVLHTYARTCKQLLTISFTHIIFKQCVVTYQIVPNACKYSLLIINHRQEESIRKTFLLSGRFYLPKVNSHTIDPHPRREHVIQKPIFWYPNKSACGISIM